MQFTRSQPGEALDQVCRRIYGTEAGTTEAVLDANPNLARFPRRLPAGTRIALPAVQVSLAADPVVKLWD